jgi:CRISPR system Cascade subunit CasD
MEYIALLFHAPIQSWGGSNLAIVNAGSPRKTENIPTKSAIEGFLRSSLGVSRGAKSISTHDLRLLIRVDRPGKRGRDYQVAQRSYQTVGSKVNKEIPKEILMDASFLVLLGHEDESVIRQLDMALRDPAFAPFYGRRSHVPSLPPYLGIIKSDDPRRTLQNLPVIWGAENYALTKKVDIYDSLTSDMRTIEMQDEILGNYHPLDAEYTNRLIGKRTLEFTREEKYTTTMDDYKELHHAISQ